MLNALKTNEDLDLLESWWITKAQRNFLAYREYVRAGDFKSGWFIAEFCKLLHQFYIDYVNGKRPVLVVTTPPQHGKSLTIADFCSWVLGLNNSLKIIYASYSDDLGVTCNLNVQRAFDSDKYKKIFPDTCISERSVVTLAHKPLRNRHAIEVCNKTITGGYFKNTTVQGEVTGKTIDLGIIDDPVKSRAEANSPTISNKIWDWYEDDFCSRFDDKAGHIVIQTRWTTHDLTGRIIQTNPDAKVVNYKAIATTDEENRKHGDPLFPELKSLEFLLGKKSKMSANGWESLYQGSPTIAGGNFIKDEWWQWWKVLPNLRYKFITADTAQKTKTTNDWTVLQCWGYGVDDRIYLLDKLRAKLKAPELRREAELFYKKHDTKRINLNDAILRAMFIEDKSSGTGLIQELKAKGLKIKEVPRQTDKVTRIEDASNFIEAGKVVLNEDIPDISNLTKEAREFPVGEFDDDIDTLVTAIEIVFINKENLYNPLEAAMLAD